MTRIARLKSEARAAAGRRGHDLGNFAHPISPVYSSRGTLITYSGGTCADVYIAKCRTCGRQVAVYPWPAPNGCEIVGEAVALNCEEVTT